MAKFEKENTEQNWLFALAEKNMQQLIFYYIISIGKGKRENNISKRHIAKRNIAFAKFKKEETNQNWWLLIIIVYL